MVFPPYVAVTRWSPTDNVVTVRLAWPLDTLAVPIVVTPSRKVTVPVIFAELELIVAVKVTGSP